MNKAIIKRVEALEKLVGVFKVGGANRIKTVRGKKYLVKQG